MKQRKFEQMSTLIKFPLYTFAFILLGLIFGYLTFKILSFSRTVEVPSLYGKSLVESNELLTRNWLYLKIEGEDYDSTVLPGHILRQDIPAGNKVKEKRGIKVILSKGPRAQSIPMLMNETLLNAETILLQNGLKIAKIIRVHSDTVEKDKIVSQKPESAEKVSDFITVLVSLGPHQVTYYCPDFKGMSIDKAKQLIEKLNLKIETSGQGSIVKAQKPQSGTFVQTGDTIFLHIEPYSEPSLNKIFGVEF